MHDQSEPTKAPIFTQARLDRLFQLLGRGIAGSVQVFLRSGYGDRALGLAHGLGVVFIVFYALLWPPEHWASVWIFLVLSVLMLNIHRIGVLRRRWFKRGPEIHSRYEGRSVLHWVLPRMSEWSIKIYAEPLLVFLVAALLVGTCPAVATYLFIASVLMSVENSAERRRLRLKAQDMNDAMINQQLTIGEFNRIRGDGH